MTHEPTLLTQLLANASALRPDVAISRIIDEAEGRWGRLWDCVIAKRMPPNRRRAVGVEDAKQEALVALRERLFMDFALITPDKKRFKSGNDIKNWMCRTSSNKAVDAVRRNGREIGASVVPAVAAGVEPNAALSDMASGTGQNVQTTHSPDELAKMRRVVCELGSKLDNAITDELAAWIDPDKHVVTLYLDFTTHREMQRQSGFGSSSVQRIIGDFLKRPDIHELTASAHAALLALVTTSFHDAIDVVETLPAQILRPLISFRGDQ